MIRCPECKKEISEINNTCPECGFPLKRKNFIKYLIIGVLLILLILCSNLIQVPYEVIEYYQVPLSYKIIDVYTANCGSFFNYVMCLYVKVLNTDKEKGQFKVNCSFKLSDKVLKSSDTKYLLPGQSEIFICKVDIDLLDSAKPNYEVVCSLKTLSKKVVKYRSLFRHLFIVR